MERRMHGICKSLTILVWKMAKTSIIDLGYLRRRFPTYRSRPWIWEIPESGSARRYDQSAWATAARLWCPRKAKRQILSRDRWVSFPVNYLAIFLYSDLLMTWPSPGDFRHENLLKDYATLEERETTLEGQEDREAFLSLMRKMLQWEPSKRSSAKELSEDKWIHQHM